MSEQFTNHLDQRVKAFKESSSKKMNMFQQHSDMWRGMPVFLSLSVLSESDKGMTAAQVASRLFRSKVYEKTNNVNAALNNMLKAGLVTAEWDKVPTAGIVAHRQFRISPAGWAFLHETEKVWADMVQKVFSVTKKKVFIRVSK